MHEIAANGTYQLDEVDRQIISLLQQDGRKSFVQLAKETGVAYATVKRKFDRLIEAGVLKVAAVANPFRLGYSSPIIVGVKVGLEHVPAAVAELVQIPEVRYVAAAAGAYDLIVEAILRSNEDIQDFLINKLAHVTGVRETETSLLFKIYKQDYDVRPL